MKELREILRDLREDHDLTQKTVAKYLGIEQQSYSNYENGNRSIPLTAVVKLADYYKVSTDYLLRAGSNDPGCLDLHCTYLSDTTLHDILYEILKFAPDNRKLLLRFIDYLKYIEQEDQTRTLPHSTGH